MATDFSTLYLPGRRGTIARHQRITSAHLEAFGLWGRIDDSQRDFGEASWSLEDTRLNESLWRSRNGVSHWMLVLYRVNRFVNVESQSHSLPKMVLFICSPLVKLGNHDHNSYG